MTVAPFVPTLSSRLPPELVPSPLHRAQAAASDAIDLMQSNPTQCRVSLPHIDLPLLGPDTWAYRPDAAGLHEARATLARYLCAHGAPPLTPADLVLTASSSESYSFILKVLCSPGDRVAVGHPGYPLVPHLAELDGVDTVAYGWRHDGCTWDVDVDSVAAALAHGRVRALVLIAPHSPTGAMPSPAAMRAVAAACAASRTVLVLDAVFAPYSGGADALGGHVNFAALPEGLGDEVATLVLSGLSKLVALPQLKLGWIALYGPEASVKPLRAGLEWVADAYLSVSTPVQVALPQILGHAPAVQAEVNGRLAQNRAALARAVVGLDGYRVVSAAGGWYGVLTVPATTAADEEALVFELLHRAQLIVHPGFYYDFGRPGYWVMGLLQPPAIFAEAMQRLRLALRTVVVNGSPAGVLARGG